MYRNTLGFLLLATIVLTISACSDADYPASPPLDVTEEPTQELRFPIDRSYNVPEDARSRWDAPWWDMSDDALADSVAVYEGRVFIGFKNPGSRGGVDRYGNVTASVSAVADGRELLQSLNLTIEHASVLLPTV